MKRICFLSGLEIPDGQLSVEHYYPISKLPERIANNHVNLYYSCKVFNMLKADSVPCVWREIREARCKYALEHYHLSRVEKKLIKTVLDKGFPERNPCDYCIARIYRQYCVRER